MAAERTTRFWGCPVYFRQPVFTSTHMKLRVSPVASAEWRCTKRLETKVADDSCSSHTASCFYLHDQNVLRQRLWWCVETIKAIQKTICTNRKPCVCVWWRSAMYPNPLDRRHSTVRQVIDKFLYLDANRKNNRNIKVGNSSSCGDKKDDHRKVTSG